MENFAVLFLLAIAGFALMGVLARYTWAIHVKPRVKWYGPQVRARARARARAR